MDFQTKYKLSIIQSARLDLIKNGLEWDDKAKEYWSDWVDWDLTDIKMQWNGYDGHLTGDLDRVEEHNEIVNHCGLDPSQHISEDFNDYLRAYVLKRNWPKNGWQHKRYSDYLEYGQ